MQFRENGVRYDTARMEVHRTGCAHRPLVYVAADDAGGRAVFVVTCDRGRGVDVHRADEREAADLAARFGIPRLNR